MANPTGKSGPRDKPFRDALRMELASAGEDHKALRQIARSLLEIAQDSKNTSCLAAIREIADRVDGKPTQSVEVGEPGAFDDMSDDALRNELLAGIREIGLAATAKRNGVKAHKDLN